MDKIHNDQKTTTQTGPEKKNQPAQTLPYSTSPGNYNRESGQKTLFFVGTLIALVTILSVASLLMINKKSNILIQSNTAEKTTTSPTPTEIFPTIYEQELNAIDLDTSGDDLKPLQSEADQL